MKTFTCLFPFTLVLFLSGQVVSAQSTAATKAAPTFEATADLATLLEVLTTVKPVPFDSLPKNKRDDVFSVGYRSLKNPTWPPLPGNFYGLDVWPLGDGHFVLDDRELDYAALITEPKSDSLQARMYFSSGSGTYSALYGTNVLWIEIVSVDLTNQLADLLVHNTRSDTFYQLSSKTNLLQPVWDLRGNQTGAGGTNVTEFFNEPIGDNATLFFRAQQADWYLVIGAGNDAVEPQASLPGMDGYFYVSGSPASSVTNNLTFFYRMSGTASNGVDYTLLTGVATMTNGGSTPITIHPVADSLVEGIETVTLTLVPTNTYLLAAGGDAATINLYDSSTKLAVVTTQPDAVEPDGPPGAPAVWGQFRFDRDDVRGIYTNRLTVAYVISGTASNVVDYSSLVGTITFAPDETQTNLDIAPLKDFLKEGLESVTITLYPTNAYRVEPSQSNATVTIVDTTTTVSFSGAATFTTIEPDGPTGAPSVSASIQVHRSDTRGIYTNMIARYAFSGTASNGADYVLSGIVNFSPGMQDTNIVLTPLGDALLEGVETVTLTLLDNATNGFVLAANTNNLTRSGTIIDTTTTVSVSPGVQNASFVYIYSPSSVEPDGPMNVPAVTTSFAVQRTDTRNIYTNLTVGYVVSGTASNGVDYSFLSGSITFAPGATSTNLILTPLPDTIIEGSETFTVSLINAPTNKYLVNTNSATASTTIIDTTTTVTISRISDAVEPGGSGGSGQNGQFQVTRTDTRGIYTNMAVYYSLSGTASNGLDYTALNGVVNFAPGVTSIFPSSNTTNFIVAPLTDSLLEGTETVTATLVTNPTNADSYLIATNTATLTISDSVFFQTVVTGINIPVGIDYHAPSNCLVVSSVNVGFLCIYTNLVMSNSILVTNVVVTNWSRISGLPEEVKLATVKTTVAGFTNGDMFFGSGNRIGWLSSDASRSNLNWCTLTNSTVFVPQPIRGGLYVDQTGVWSNKLVVATSPSSGSAPDKGIWVVNSNGQPSLIATIGTPHLEGVISLPNDTNKWGSWAGKIISGDELTPPNLQLYAVSTNGVVTPYDTTQLITNGMASEDFEIIPPNQSLYACDQARGAILKFPASYLADFVGDLLITEAGEQNAPAKLFILHWDSAATNFTVRRINCIRSDGSNAEFEHVTFAPIELPKK